MFRLHGHDATASTCELHAAELEAALRDAEAEELTMAESVIASRYSERRLRELVAVGALENVGKKGSPRFRRGDLPKKPRGRSCSGYDVEVHAREIVGRLDGP